MKAATITPVVNGLMADFSDEEFPCQAYGIKGVGDGVYSHFTVHQPGTAYGYLAKGTATLLADGKAAYISSDDYFSLPAHKRIKVMVSPDSVGFFAYRLGYFGLRLQGTGLEDKGRLKYIDGCGDTLLIAPPLRGDPCFNLLHFPVGITQTKHTHPSVRIGMIHHGKGKCETADGVEPLLDGSMFILAPDAVHAFVTADNDMRLTVFHPDSDFGPTHEEHPMLNRTIVDGTSAKHLKDIQTKEIV